MPETPLPTHPQEPHAPEPQGPIIHTYEDDLSLAMNTTEASVVQDLLKTAREREEGERNRIETHKQKRWYTAGAVILILLGLGAATYGVYYFRTLTVPVVPTASVGVFQSTAPVATESATPLQIVTNADTDTSIPLNKPVLVPLTLDGAPRSYEDTLTYLGMEFGEPFAAAFSIARLGIYRTDDGASPFVILYAPNPEIASKELLIAEPKLLEALAPLLRIDTLQPINEVGTSFTSTYMYNLPVRTLISRNIDTNIETITLYYGYATDQTVVIASNPQVLKSVYDTIIRQR